MRSISGLSCRLSLRRERQCSTILSLALIVCAFTAVAPAQKPQAALPHVYIDTTWNPPTGGTPWAVHTAAQLTGALNASAPGDIIVLDAGTIYSGNFIVPAKSNPNKQWTYVISSALASMPPGMRVYPASRRYMPKIVSPNASQALSFANGANHWRFAGIEVYSASTYHPNGYTPGVNYAYALIDKHTYPSVTLPDSIVFDRVYLHGDATHDVQRAISANYSNAALVDSYISDIHMQGTETQAIGAWATPGPIKIVNNYLSAATETIMFGGGGGWNNPYVPSDIEIRNNYLYKPLSWAKSGEGGTLLPHNQWVEKNAFEIKNAQRVLFDRNTIQNVWAAGQAGYAIVLTVRTSQSGDIAVVNDITITNNLLNNVVAGFNTMAKDDVCGATGGYPNCHNAGSQDRWYIANNQITFYDPTLPGGARNVAVGFTNGMDRLNHNAQGVMRDVVFEHNTTVSAPSTPCWEAIFFSAGTQKLPLTKLTQNIWVLDNTLCRQPTGDYGLQGTAGLTQYMGSPSTPPYGLTQRFYGNVMYVPSNNWVQTFPPGNYATTVPFTYVNPTTGDFQLVTPKWTDTTDGRLAGVNYSSLP